MKKLSVHTRILSVLAALGMLLGMASVSAATQDVKTSTNMENNSDITVPAGSISKWRCPPNC